MSTYSPRHELGSLFLNIICYSALSEMNKLIIFNNYLTVWNKKKCLKQNIHRIMQRTYSKNRSIFSFFGINGLKLTHSKSSESWTTPCHLWMRQKYFCFYPRNCRTLPKCLQLAREGGLPGLLCTFVFSASLTRPWLRHHTPAILNIFNSTR